MSQLVSKAAFLGGSVLEHQFAVLPPLVEGPPHQHLLRRRAAALRLLQPLNNLLIHSGHGEKLFGSDLFQIVHL